MASTASRRRVRAQKPWYEAVMFVDSLSSELRALLPSLVELRHDLHRHPELGFEEERTQGVVRRWLEQHDLSGRACAGTGVVADLHPDRFGRERTVALRADMDALPIHETTPLSYSSSVDGCSHKCGHDGHTAILLGVAALLARHRARVPGNVRLLFQPAEEGGAGGKL